jgi:hypothetical protein
MMWPSEWKGSRRSTDLQKISKDSRPSADSQNYDCSRGWKLDAVDGQLSHTGACFSSLLLMQVPAALLLSLHFLYILVCATVSQDEGRVFCLFPKINKIPSPSQRTVAPLVLSLAS